MPVPSEARSPPDVASDDPGWLPGWVSGWVPGWPGRAAGPAGAGGLPWAPGPPGADDGPDSAAGRGQPSRAPPASSATAITSSTTSGG